MDEIRVDCERVLALVPSFVDEEVSNDVAASVRSHLIDCAPCRVAVQDASALRQWFEPVAFESADVEVPEGFASRVTEFAFAGAERGQEPIVQIAPAAGPVGAPPRPRLVRDDDGHVGTERVSERGLSFAMTMTAIAAAILMVFTLLLASGEKDAPEADLSADQPLLEEIERLNESLDQPAEGTGRGRRQR